MNEIKRVLRLIATILMIPLFIILLGSGLFTIAGELAQDRHPAVLAAMSLVTVGLAVAGAIFGWKVTGGRKPGTTRRKAIIRGLQFMVVMACVAMLIAMALNLSREASQDWPPAVQIVMLLVFAGIGLAVCRWVMTRNLK